MLLIVTCLCSGCLETLAAALFRAKDDCSGITCEGLIPGEFGESLISKIRHSPSGETIMVSARKLVGLNVITSDAHKLGQVDGTDVDTDSWKVTHLHIGLTDEAARELAFKKPLLGGITICLPVSYVSKTGDVVTLKTTLADVRNTPECKAK